jgi:hypothetical protein
MKHQQNRYSRCPRCTTGQLYLDSDLFSDELVCLQCGFRRDLPKGMAA